MSSVAPPGVLERRFEAVVFDWDGTAVPDRRAEAGGLRALIETLCSSGVDVAIVSGTHLGNVDGQLRARPSGPGRLQLLLNRGSEVFRVGRDGVEVVHRRAATAVEEAALSAAAELAVRRLAEHGGIEAKIVSSRLNRRKIDLIPEDAWADPPKARLPALLRAVQDRLSRSGASLPEVVEIVMAAARDAGLAAPRVTSDAKHVEIGLTDKSDSARFIFADLWARGVGAGLVLLAGDEMGPLGGLPGSDSLMLVSEARGATVVSVGPEPEGVPPGVVRIGGGPEAFVSVLRDQVARRERGDLPELDGDPRWSLAIDEFDLLLERAREAQLTLGDGSFGSAGSAMVDLAGRRRVLAGGVYDGAGAEARLLACPEWNHVTSRVPAAFALRRRLDLRTGVMREDFESSGESMSVVMFVSEARPGTTALRACGPSGWMTAPPLQAPADARVAAAGTLDGGPWIAVGTSADGGVVAAAREERRGGAWPTLDRIASYAATARPPEDPRAAIEGLREASRAGFERMLIEQRAAWARRWEDADVVIEGDDGLQRDVRFALFHLMATVKDAGEAAVGARGLSGPAYRGHVFWDADVFVLPFLAATHPESARAMLEYRLRRLAAAEVRARAEGRDGARFPWESAGDGLEASPGEARDLTGKTVAIRTGEREEHIVADVAWAAACYVDWSGDASFAEDGAARLLSATARYWASRVRFDDEGRAHIEGVIGPDEYHDPVDDNAFTNVMARWNLRRAAATVARGSGASDAERRRWLEVAGALVDGYDPVTGVYEQFAGFRDLEPLLISKLVRTRPVAADLLLGLDRVRAAQVLKQADVLMLHHMVPDEAAPGSLSRNLAYYEPRTAHGSSLSPGVHAGLFAREGRFDEALELLRLASRIDLDDVSESTAGGLHLATMGSVWQALAFGFGGLRPRAGVLEIDPRLPPAWRALELRVRMGGSRVRVRTERDSVRVTASPSAAVRLRGMTDPVLASEAGVTLARSKQSDQSEESRP